VDDTPGIHEKAAMSQQSARPSRRQFFRRGGAAVASAGTIAGLGLDLSPVRAAAAKLKIKEAREVPSICLSCAVG